MSTPRLLPRVRHRQRRHQLACVLVMRVAHNLKTPAFFDELAVSQHTYPVRDHVHHREIVADEQRCEPEFTLEALKQVKHDCLHRYIEC